MNHTLSISHSPRLRKTCFKQVVIHSSYESFNIIHKNDSLFSVLLEFLLSLQKRHSYAVAWWTKNGTGIFLNASTLDISEKQSSILCKFQWFLRTHGGEILIDSFKRFKFSFSAPLLLLIICSILLYHMGYIFATVLFIGGSVCNFIIHRRVN